MIAAGAATVTKKIELTVDQAALVTDANNPTNPRAIKREEVVMALITLIMALQRDNTTLNV